MGELLRKLMFWRKSTVAEAVVSDVEGCFTLPEAIAAEETCDGGVTNEPAPSAENTIEG